MAVVAQDEDRVRGGVDMRLRKCLCGKPPELWDGIYHDELRMYHCEDCNLSTWLWHSGNDAAAQWNYIVREELKKRKT